jgi:hypothetical protein
LHFAAIPFPQIAKLERLLRRVAEAVYRNGKNAKA